jgi:hypothetical protein
MKGYAKVGQEARACEAFLRAHRKVKFWPFLRGKSRENSPLEHFTRARMVFLSLAGTSCGKTPLLATRLHYFVDFTSEQVNVKSLPYHG